MNKLIIIDDINCKNDLETFLNEHAENIKMIVDEDDVNVKVKILLDSLKEIQNSSQKIPLELFDQIKLIEVEKIVKFVKEGLLVLIHLNDQSSFIIADSFDDLVKHLRPYKFSRVSENVIMNLRYISKINLAGEKYIETEFGEKIQIDASTLNKLVTMF